MKIKYLKLKSWLLMTLMCALGMAGCKSTAKVAETTTPGPEPQAKPAPREEIKLMYGVPTMNYMIRGQVRDNGGRPIGDIRINMLERGMETVDDSLMGDPERVKEYLERTDVSTDKDGHFVIEKSGTPQENVRLLVRDVDGEEGGSFKNRLVEIRVTPADVDRSNAGGWNQGTFNKELNIELENK